MDIIIHTAFFGVHIGALILYRLYRSCLLCRNRLF